MPTDIEIGILITYRRSKHSLLVSY